ncbi:glycoside hydrolase family 88 protein [Prolixibacteraceae bacterium]|nr:glycoside hydrolase family 88 protein [Prolixibacteraceae bacterium]
MKFKGVFLSMLSIVLLGSCGMDKETFIESNLEFADQQFTNAINETKEDIDLIPRTIKEDGSLKNVKKYNWTSGFFAGDLWYMYKLTGDQKWKTEAIKRTEVLDTIQYWSGNHDVGFMIGDSYGLGYRFAGIKAYAPVVVQTAESLIKRYSDNTKAIKSWNYRKAWDKKTEWFYPVIIDNMMNLELLYEASIISGDDKYSKIATQHALTTMKHHYRKDYSCYHVVDYDTITGAVKDKATCQGFADNSAWSRGQAWGLYGYVLCYRYTKDKQFLDFAENIAKYILDHPNMPEDLVPYWDYNVFDKGYKAEWNYDPNHKLIGSKDASAAAIASSALFELADQTGNATYREKAEKMLVSLSEKYKARPNNKYFILDHSVGSFPHNGEIDVPLSYADYYFLEALLRYKESK